MQFYESRLATEPADRGWAWAAERRLAESAQSEQLGQAEVLRAACGSTLCTLHLRFADAGALRDFELRWRSAEDWAEMGEAFLRRQDVEDLEVEMYVARGGHPLPPFPVSPSVGPAERPAEREP